MSNVHHILSGFIKGRIMKPNSTDICFQVFRVKGFRIFSVIQSFPAYSSNALSRFLSPSFGCITCRTLIPMISLDYFKSPLFYPDHILIFNRMKRPKSKLECDLFFNLILIGFENQNYF
jgi:hypothetical protein